MPDTPPKKPLSPFFQRYNQMGAASQDSRVFSSALNRYFRQKYSLPEATSPGGRTAVGTAIKAGLLLDGDGTGLPGFNVALNEIMSSLFGTPSGNSPLVPGSQIDVTDPSVALGEGEKLGPLEHFLRSMRMVSRAMGVGMFRGASVAPSTGLALAYEEGELARPKTQEDQMLHTIGAMLAGAAPFMGANALAAPVEAAAGGFGSSIARGAGMGGVGEAGAGASEELLARLAQQGIPGAAGAPEAAATVGGIAKGMLGDAAIGAGFGAAEAYGQGSLMRATGEGDEAPSVTKMARDYALFGLGLGALFRIPTKTNAIRFVRSITGDGEPRQGIDIAPGIVHDGIKSELVNGKLRFRREGTPGWISAKSLTPENLDAFRKLSAQRARDLVSDTPGAQATAAAVAQTTPHQPATLPNDLATPDGLALQNTYGGMYFRRAQSLINHLGREKVERQVDELRKVLWSDAPLNERLSVGGRIVALENALGQGTRLPGQLPVELEAQAIETVAKLRPYGRTQIEQAAVDAALGGRRAYADRLRALMDTDLPETYSREINTRLAKVNTQMSKGVRQGTYGIVDGRPVEIMQRPKLGLAWGRRLDEPGADPINVDVENFKPYPKAGQVVALKDGRISRVRAVDPGKGQILIDVPNKTLKDIPFEENAPIPGWVSVDEITEVASSRTSFRSLRNQQAALLDEFHATEATDTAIPAVSDTGEPLTVIGIGEGVVKVKTKSGRVKTIPRGQVEVAETTRLKQQADQNIDAMAGNEAAKAGYALVNPTGLDTEAEAIKLANAVAVKNPKIGMVVDRYYVMVPDEKIAGAIGVPGGAEAPAPEPGKSTLRVSHRQGKAVNPLSELDDQIAMHRAAIDESNRGIGTFTPGKVPAEGNRILYFRIAGSQRDAFEQAWKGGKPVARYVIDGRYGVGKGGKKVPVIQMHVLPQPGQSGDLLYSIELPANSLPKKDYYGSANEALRALSGKGTINTYASVVDIPQDVFSTGQVSKVPESLRNSSIRPQEVLRTMSQQEQTEYLRHLLVFNENIPSEVAQPVAEAQAARIAITDAANAGDGQMLIQAETQLEASHVKAAEALERVRVENNQPAYNQLITDLQSGDETASAREAFELQGLTDKTKDYYFQQLDELPTAMDGDPAKDALIANSLNVEGQRAFISKYERPYVEYGKPGITKPAGETQPVGLPFYTVEVVDPEGLTIRGATKRFETPTEVAKYLNGEGFAATLYKTHAGEYYHESNPALTAVVQPAKQGHGATMTIKELPPTKVGTETVDTGFTKEQEELLVEFKELHREQASNGPQWKTVAQRKFKTANAAQKFLQEKGFLRREPVPDLTDHFKDLPPMSHIEAVAKGEAELASHAQRRKVVIARLDSYVKKNAEALAKTKGISPEAARAELKDRAALELYTWDRDNGKNLGPDASKDWAAGDYMKNVEERLNNLLRVYSRQTGRVPEAVQSYAQEFSQHYYKVTGKPPFNKYIRTDVVGMPHVSDYGTDAELGSALGGMIEDEHHYSEETGGRTVAELPESVRAMASIRVGKSMGQMARAMEEIAQTVNDRPAPGLFETQQWLMHELMSTAEILNKSHDMKAVEGAQARANELKRTAVAYEKLRMRVRPSSGMMGGEIAEADMIARAERQMRRRGAKITSTPQPEGLQKANPRRLTELDLLPANEEVMRLLSGLGEGTDAIKEGPGGEQFITTLPHDYEAGGHIFYPNVLGISTLSKSDILENAERMAAAQKQQTLWAEAAMKTQRIIPEPAKFDVRTDMNLVRYKGTGQIAEIIDTPENVLTNPEVLVRFLDGQEMTVAKEELSLPGPGKGDWSRDYRMAEYILDGRYASMYHREPPLGFGSLEKELGIFGTKDRGVVAGAIFDRARELLAQTRRSGEGYKETWQGLFDLYHRARSLDELVDVERNPTLSTKILQEDQAGKFLPRAKTAGPGFGEEAILGENVPTLMGERQANPDYRSSFEAAEAYGEVGSAQLRGETPTSQLHFDKNVQKFVKGKLVDEHTVKKVKLLRAINANTQNMGDIILDAIAEKDPKLVNRFKRASYEKLIQKLGDHPFAELQAQAMSGYLTDGQAATLRGYANEIGLPREMSLPRIVVEMRERQALDPTAALYAVQTRKQAAIINWAEQAAGGNALFSGIPIGGMGERGMPTVIIKPVADIHDLRFGGVFGSTWKVAQKHPFIQHVVNMIYRAQENQQKAVIRRPQEFMVNLDQLGIKSKDRNAIRNMILDVHEHDVQARARGEKEWKTWDEIAANHPTIKALSPEMRQKYSQAYFSYRRYFAEGKQEVIRHFLRRKVKPIIYDPANPDHLEFAQALAKEYGVDASTLKEGSALLPFQPELIYKNSKFADYGMAPRGYNEDEISFFLNLQTQFGSSKELPAGPPPGIRPEIYEEFRGTFDFWQRYGHDNYWPLVHEGSIAAVDGNNKIVAWGQTMPDVWESVRELRKQERLSDQEPITIKHVGMVADDIMMQATQSKGEFRQLTAMYAEQLNMNPDEVMIMLQRADRPEAVMKRPGQVHGKPRVAGLKPVRIDADKEFSLLNARIARMDYRWDVLQAWRAFQDTHLDRALSDAYGAPRVHESMPGLKGWTEDLFATAVGERRSAEKVADHLWMILNWMKQAPRELPAVLRGELDLGTVLNPQTYYRKYAARSRASDLLKVQTLWRLGFSQGSAFANWTQFFITTVPKLVQPGEDVGHVAKLVYQGQRDGFKLWRAWDSRKPLTGEMAVLSDMLNDAGIDLVAAKQMAGGRSVGDVLNGRPLETGSKYQMAKNWLDYTSLWSFNGAEKINRFGTGVVAIRRYADRLGKSVEQLTSVERAEAVESARRLVRETQFSYDELSLPRALRSGPLAGPLGRILFQFKPFLLNMIEYESGLVHNAFFNPTTRGGKVALGQLGAHFAALAVFGGAVGVLHNPLLSIPYQIVNWATGGDLIDPATKLSAAQRKRRRQMQSPEENFQQSSNFTSSDLLAYGLPGLIGLDMGQRVGVSGQDLTMSLADIPGLAGPHAAAYIDMWNAWKKYGYSKGSARGLAGAAAGALASSFIPDAIRKEVPWARSMSATAGAVLASKGQLNDFGSFLKNTPEGQQVFSRLMWTAVRNAQRTYTLLHDGAVRDMDGKPMNVPASDRYSSAAAMALGMPTVRRDEYTSMIGMMTGSSAPRENTRYILTAKAARAWAAGDYGSFYEIMYKANEEDVDISQQAIEQELESLTQERMTSIYQRLPVSERIRQ